MRPNKNPVFNYKKLNFCKIYISFHKIIESAEKFNRSLLKQDLTEDIFDKI